MSENKTEMIEGKYTRESLMSNVGFTVFALIVIGVILGCKTCSDPDIKESPATEVTAGKVLPAGHPEIPAGHPEIPSGHPAVHSSDQSFDETPHFKGEVLETMNAGRYTYVSVDTGEEKIWAAAPHFNVKVGDQVMLPKGMPMKDFKSPSLKRNFEMIYFCATIKVVDGK